jgi:polysaccharide biosynthesis protein PslG
MPCRLLFAIVLVVLSLLVIPKQLPGTESPAHLPLVPVQFFGMNTHWFQPWPALPVPTARLWCTGTSWAQLNPSNGVYDWTPLDEWLDAFQQHGTTDAMLTLAMTPRWASSHRDDRTCAFGPGQCAPPDDLNADGSGTDEHWRNYITAVANHVHGRIKYWELWDEPVNAIYWTGTFAQMVRMAKDARSIIRSIDPNALVLSPPNGASTPYGQHWWEGYAALGGLNSADIISLHGGGVSSCGHPPQAADFIATVNNLRGIVAKYHAGGKPIWDTESSWGTVNHTCFTDQDLQAAFLAQFYLFHQSMNVARFYWFAYDDNYTGKLWEPSTGKLTKGGVAYQQVFNWMVGATMTQNCSSSNKSLWTCGFSGPNGYVAKAIWDLSQSCRNGQCGTINYSVNSIYTRYRMLDGETRTITNHRVPVGAKPILLENHSR